MCLPPDDGHLAEWESNLVGQVEFAADPYPAHPKPPPGRRLIGYRTETFAGGFMTCGALIEGAEVELAEGWTGRDLARASHCLRRPAGRSDGGWVGACSPA